MIGQLQWCRGEFGIARARLEEGLALFDPADRPFYAALSLQDAQAMMLEFLSDLLSALGYLNQSRARGDEALAVARRLAQPFTVAMALINLVPAMMRVGRSDRASALCRADPRRGAGSSRCRAELPGALGRGPHLSRMVPCRVGADA